MSLVRKMKLKSQMTQSAMILRNSPCASKMGSKERKVEEEKDKEMNSQLCVPRLLFPVESEFRVSESQEKNPRGKARIINRLNPNVTSCSTIEPRSQQ